MKKNQRKEERIIFITLLNSITMKSYNNGLNEGRKRGERKNTLI